MLTNVLDRCLKDIREGSRGASRRRAYFKQDATSALSGHHPPHHWTGDCWVWSCPPCCGTLYHGQLGQISQALCQAPCLSTTTHPKGVERIGYCHHLGPGGVGTAVGQQKVAVTLGLNPGLLPRAAKSLRLPLLIAYAWSWKYSPNKHTPGLRRPTVFLLHQPLSTPSKIPPSATSQYYPLSQCAPYTACWKLLAWLQSGACCGHPRTAW